MAEAKTSRRKFLTTGAAAIAGGAAAASLPNISVGASPVVLKVQAAWAAVFFWNSPRITSSALMKCRVDP